MAPVAARLTIAFVGIRSSGADAVALALLVRRGWCLPGPASTGTC